MVRVFKLRNPYFNHKSVPLKLPAPYLAHPTRTTKKEECGSTCLGFVLVIGLFKHFVLIKVSLSKHYAVLVFFYYVAITLIIGENTQKRIKY